MFKKNNIYTFLSILFFIISVIQFMNIAGCFNHIRYHSRYNEKRKEVGLQPFIDTWRKDSNFTWGEWWFNPNEKSQGLYCWYKRLNTVSSNLDFEMDAWVYKEGDSINIMITHTFFYNPQNYNQTDFGKKNHIYEVINDSTNFLRTNKLSVDNSTEFIKTMEYLENREANIMNVR